MQTWTMQRWAEDRASRQVRRQLLELTILKDIKMAWEEKDRCKMEAGLAAGAAWSRDRINRITHRPRRPSLWRLNACRRPGGLIEICDPGERLPDRCLWSHLFAGMSFELCDFGNLGR